MTIPVIICSNIDTQKYPNNTRQSFKNSLARTLNFNNSKHVINISSIYIDLKFSKIPEYLLQNPLYIYKVTEIGNPVITTPPGLNFLEHISNGNDLEYLFSKMLGSSSLVKVIETDTHFKLVLSQYGMAMDYNLATYIGVENINRYILSSVTLPYGKPAKYIFLGTTVNFEKKHFIANPRPKTIQVVLEEIEPIPTGDGFSKCIASIPIQDEDSGSLALEFKNKQYFNTPSIIASSFHVKLLDENNNPVKFGNGQASVIVLNINPKMDNSFIISTKSNDSNMKHVSNTPSDYIIELPAPISFEGDWEAALTIANLPQDINLSSYLGSEYFIFRGNPEDTKFSINTSELYSSTDLIDPLKQAIEKTLANANVNIDGTRVEVTVEIDTNNTLSITCPVQTSIQLSPALSELFGISSITTLNFEPNTAINLGYINLSLLRPQIALIHTNFSAHVILGNKMSQIIKIIPIQPRHKPNIYESESLDFIRVNTPYLTKICIQLLDITNKPIMFRKTDICMINFIFRKTTKK